MHNMQCNIEVSVYFMCLFQGKTVMVVSAGGTYAFAYGTRLYSSIKKLFFISSVSLTKKKNKTYLLH